MVEWDGSRGGKKETGSTREEGRGAKRGRNGLKLHVNAVLAVKIEVHFEPKRHSSCVSSSLSPSFQLDSFSFFGKRIRLSFLCRIIFLDQVKKRCLITVIIIVALL